MADPLFVSNNEVEAWLQSRDWSQTPLGAVETWSDSLKTTVQTLLAELYQSNPPEKTQVEQVEAALDESEAKYRTLFESIDKGFCIVKVLFDPTHTPIDYLVLEVNSIFEQQTGLQQAVGKTARQLGLENHWIEVYGQVALTGESVRFENSSDGQNRWFDIYACRIGKPAARKVAIVFKDISDRKRADKILRHTTELDAFRISLTDALRPIADPVEVQATASRMLGEYLDANRVAYFMVCGADYVVERDYVNGAEALVGNYPIDSFGSKLLAAYRAGRAVSASNVEEDPNLSPVQRAAYAALQIGAYIGIPLVKEGKFVAGLAVHTAGSRTWTPDEVSLAEEVAERTWAAVERTRAEAVLRRSEERYRALFESIDEGFGVIEVLFDADGKPFDHCILQANPAFERQSGISNPAGKRASELVPGVEQDWNDLYAQVIHTGESIRTEMRSDALNRWFDVLVSRIDDGATHQVAVVFTDISDRKKAEAVLRASHNTFRHLVQNSPFGVYVIDADFRLMQVSAGAQKVFETIRPLSGRDFAEVLRTLWVEPFASESIALFRHTLETGEPYRSPSTIERRHDIGEVESYDWKIERITLPDGTFGVVCHFYDLSERQRYETALHESEERFRNMADNAPVMVWMTDSTGYCTYLSQRWYEFTGQTEETGLGFGWLSRTHPDDREAAERIFRNASQQEEAFRLEYRLQRKDGEYVWAIDAASPWCDVDGQFKGYIGSVIDISDRKQAEAALCESEDRLRLALKSAELGTWDFNPMTGRLQWDDQCKAMFGLSPTSEISYDVFLSGLHPDDRDRTDQVVQVALNPDSNGEYEIEYRTIGIEDGVERWIAAKGKAFFNSAGIASRFIGTVLNITEKKQAETERESLLQREQSARETAERANRIKDEFLAVLSHELRSPLNPILGWTCLMQNGNLDEAHQAQALKTIERNAKLQSQLIEDLLDISRIIQGKLSLTAAPVSLTVVISAAIETVRLAAEAKNIQIKLDLAPGLDPISGDAARLQQVLWNLLTNAVKFTPNGGKVTVELRQIAQIAQIRVLDTGKGINSDFLPHVFEYFRQEDGSTTRKFGGLGLGLAIVRQVVELHGGAVRVESKGENQGATFIVQLPTQPQETQIVSELTQAQAASERRLNTIKILLVDDDNDTREFQTFLLEQYGATVFPAASGLEALQALDQFMPDVIVSDIGMAEIDGYTLMQQIRSLSPVQGGMIPAIALTAYAAEIDQKRAMQAGFQKHLTKPLEPEQLVSTIISLLGSDESVILT